MGRGPEQPFSPREGQGLRRSHSRTYSEAFGPELPLKPEGLLPRVGTLVRGALLTPGGLSSVTLWSSAHHPTESRSWG